MLPAGIPRCESDTGLKPDSGSPATAQGQLRKAGETESQSLHNVGPWGSFTDLL